MTHAEAAAELNSKTKDELVKLARSHGWAGDDARTTKAQLVEFVALKMTGDLAATAATSETAATSATAAALKPAAPVQAAPAPAAPTVAPEAAAQLLGLIQSLAPKAEGVNPEQVKQIVQPMLDELAAKVDLRPVRVEIVTKTGETKDLGRQHKQFPDLLKGLQATQQVWLGGPAGSGKTTAAENAAKALGLPFYFNGAIDTEYKLLGFIDANGRIISTAFKKAFTEGGVYLFDEVDASLPSATLAFNAALANGYADFPEGMVKRNADFYVMAAGNTFGMGATADYIGRNKMDAAFTDRFISILWGYDEALERSIAGNDEWVSYIQTMRAKAVAKGLKIVISPRASIFGAKLLAAGFSKKEAFAMTIGNKITAEQAKNLEA